MTLVIYALKNLKKEIVVNLLNVVQLSAVIVIAVIMVSSVMMRYRYYAPFGDILRSNGILCSFTPPANYDSEKQQDPFKYIADDELKNFLPDAEDVISCNNGPSWLVDENDETIETDSAVILYDDDFIERFKPEIESGRWLNKSSDADFIEGVVSENNLGIKVGDTVRVAFFSADKKDNYQYVRIVGKLPENAKIAGYWRGNSAKKSLDMSYLYGTASFEVEQQVVILMSSKYIADNTTVMQGIFGPALITFPEDYPQDKIERARQQLADYNCRSSYLLSEINANSMEYIFEYIDNLLPIIIVLLIMIIVSSISGSALSTRRGIRNYAVLYITGLEWRKCAIINLIQAAVVLMCSIAVSGTILGVMSVAGVGVKLLINSLTAISIIAVAVFYIAVSMIMPMIMLSGTTPKQILTK